ncbi:MAG: tetratricopeptide repeat protein, partial [Candidatus Cloacimonetes bacterium]|nr:tetratricopeptide repeat protein [Candidatus Cloacimonadota bacterium]
MFSKIRNKLRWFIIILALHLPLLCYTDNEISHSNQNKSNNSNILNLLEQAEEARELKIQDAIAFGNEALKLAKQIQSQKLEVEALISISESYRRTGEYDKSKLLGDKALLIAEELQDNLLISKSLAVMSELLITVNDLRTAFETCSRLLEINYEKKNEFAGLTYVYIGIIFRKIENYEKAIEYHQKALDHHEDNIYVEYNILENYLDYKSFVITNLGYDYRINGDVKKSLDIFIDLLERTPQSETYIYGRALNHIGVTFLIMEDFEKALDYCEQALNYFEFENELHKMGNIYNDLARIYFLTGDFPKALEYNLISLNKRKELNRSGLIASSYRNIADNYLDIADYTKSEEYYLKSLAEAEKVSDHNILQYVHGRMAEMYEEQNKDSSALQSFKKYNALYKILQD